MVVCKLPSVTSTRGKELPRSYFCKHPHPSAGLLQSNTGSPALSASGHKPVLNTPEQREMAAAAWKASRILGMLLHVISFVPPSASLTEQGLRCRSGGKEVVHTVYVSNILQISSGAV